MGSYRSLSSRTPAFSQRRSPAGQRPGVPGRHPLADPHWCSLARHTCRSPLGQYLLAATTGMGRRRSPRRDPRRPDRATRRPRPGGFRGIARRCHLHSRKKGGPDVGKTKVGKGMKLEDVVDASGLPLGMAAESAAVSEQELLKPALDDVPVEVPPGTPVIADKGHDSDPLRDELEDAQYTPVIPHRKNRVKP